MDKIQCLQLPFLYIISRVQREVSDKERDSAFCCPNIACGNCAVHGSRPALPDKIELLQRVWKNFSSVLDVGQKTLYLFFFFFLVKGQQVNVDRWPL